MRHRSILAFSCFALFSVLPVTATAQSSSSGSASGGMKKEIAKVKDACKDDMNKYCTSITPGEGRIAACLQSREDQLSLECQNAWFSAKNKISRAMDQTEVAFRKNCSNDAQKFCSNVPTGQGRMLKCLDQHKADLSNSCQQFTLTLNERLSKAMG